MINIPASPMIDVTGTAPEFASISTGTPGEHGGKMDCIKIRKGTARHLQVNVDGALSNLRDIHAVMGDGETAVCAAENTGEATVNISVLNNLTIHAALLRTENEYVAISSAESVDNPCDAASKEYQHFSGWQQICTLQSGSCCCRKLPSLKHAVWQIH